MQKNYNFPTAFNFHSVISVHLRLSSTCLPVPPCLLPLESICLPLRLVQMEQHDKGRGANPFPPCHLQAFRSATLLFHLDQGVACWRETSQYMCYVHICVCPWVCAGEWGEGGTWSKADLACTAMSPSSSSSSLSSTCQSQSHCHGEDLKNIGTLPRQ